MAKRAAFSNTIWRTVVFAGAMLATPVIAGCGGSSKPATTPTETMTTEDQATADKAAADAKAADDAKAAEAWRCRVLVAEVGRLARRGGLVRINVRAKDLKRASRVEAALTAIDAALTEGAQASTYRLPATTRAA
ncbi:MAG: hypothetical protein H0T42_31865 [Deltaproteobacteria bacterium]|nr:hypothetical protein [Deltaproteobacteria bacterium]